MLHVRFILPCLSCGFRKLDIAVYLHGSVLAVLRFPHRVCGFRKTDIGCNLRDLTSLLRCC